MTQAAAWLADQGDTTPHAYGEAARAQLGDAPRYVWVPTRSRDRQDTNVRDVEEVRELSVHQEHLEIDCWGASAAQAWALRCNVWNALYQTFLADLEFEAGAWVRPGAAVNQRGELYRLEVSIRVPIAEGFIDPTDLAAPEPDLFTVEGVEAQIFKSPATDVDGELGVTVDTD
jgi:hypothetical protein